MKIAYFTDQDRLSDKLKALLKAEGLTMVPWEAAGDTSDLDVVMLYSPLYCNDTYVDYEGLWHNYLKKYVPKCKLIIAGLTRKSPSNYLYLFEPPSSLSLFFQSAQPLHLTIPTGNSEGLSGTQLMYKFYMGHGKDSIMAALKKFRSISETVSNELKKGTPVDELIQGYIEPTKTVQNWREFYLRWEFFFPWASCMPMHETFQEVNTMVKEVDNFLKNGELDLTLFADLGRILTIENILDQFKPVP
jgi:hypothetical protein